ncbi:MAG: hypothetical protein LH628_09685 [Microcoleus sp. CAN_BIN18]|nr:hypothetical protein [Microcoleus sp. CAN_BIN18]
MNSLLLISPYKGEALNQFFLVNKLKPEKLGLSWQAKDCLIHPAFIF